MKWETEGKGEEIRGEGIFNMPLPFTDPGYEFHS